MKERRRVYGSDSGLGDALTLRIIDYNVRVYSGENDITDNINLYGTPMHIGTDPDGNIYLVENNNSDNMCMFSGYPVEDLSTRTIYYSSSSLESYNNRVPSISCTLYDTLCRTGYRSAYAVNYSNGANIVISDSGNVYIQQVYKNRYLVTSETYGEGEYYQLSVIDTKSSVFLRSSYTLYSFGSLMPYCAVLPQVGNSDTIVIAYYDSYSSVSFYISTYAGDFTDSVISGNLAHLPTNNFVININNSFGTSYYGCTPMSAYVDDTGVYLYVQCFTEGDYGYNYYYEYLRYSGGRVTRMTTASSVKINGMIANDGKSTYIFEPSYGSSPTSRSYISNDPLGSNMTFTQMTDYSLLGIQMPLPKS